VRTLRAALCRGFALLIPCGDGCAASMIAFACALRLQIGATPANPRKRGHASPATDRLRRTVKLVGTQGCLAAFGSPLLGAPPGRRSALNACSALERRQVTRGKRNSRVAALKSSPVPARFAPRAAASGLPLDFRKLAPCSMTARALQARRINNQETTHAHE